MKRRRSLSLPTEPETEIKPSILSTESDAGDRVRDWDLPISVSRTRSNNVFASLAFIGIISLAAFAVWYLLKHMQPAVKLPAISVATEAPPTTPVEVDILPGAKSNSSSSDLPRENQPGTKVVARLSAPQVDGKWSLTEYPNSGDLVELDPSGFYAYAKNFTETCVRSAKGTTIDVGIRARDSSVSVRSNVNAAEACAMIFDEPLFEVKIAPNELRAVQFGLQQGAPFVAVRRIKSASVPLQTIRALP